MMSARVTADSIAASAAADEGALRGSPRLCGNSITPCLRQEIPEVSRDGSNSGSEDFNCPRARVLITPMLPNCFASRQVISALSKLDQVPFEIVDHSKLYSLPGASRSSPDSGFRSPNSYSQEHPD